nr:hypothetical protein Iba_scaffold3961.4CG0900 [Ipomoea batatas]
MQIDGFYLFSNLSCLSISSLAFLRQVRHDQCVSPSRNSYQRNDGQSEKCKLPYRKESHCKSDKKLGNVAMASLEMWKIMSLALVSVSKNSIFFLSTDCRYLNRKRAVCLSPVCVQNATPGDQ